MKKSISLAIFSAAILLAPYGALAQQGTISPTSVSVFPSPIRVCPYDKIYKPGSSGDDVKALQSLLGEDQTIYPEGLKTGFYGRLTEEAVKKLQRKVGIAETGIVDDDTREIILPCVTLRVVSPNGGEVWNVGETHEITWETEAPYYILNQGADSSEGKLQELTPQRGAALPQNAIRPFYPHLSIDLVRSDVTSINFGSAAVFHIGGASLYGDRSFKWTIPRSIPEAKSYKVRISVWKNVPEPFDCKTGPCPLAPQAYPRIWKGNLWDESDSEFAILGGSGTVPPPTPTPIPDPRLRELRQQIAEIIERLQKTLRLIDEMLINVR